MTMSMFNIITITNRKLCNRPLTEQIERIAREVKLDKLILREKDLSEKEYEKLAADVMKICRENHIDCILHTFIQVAVRLNCSKIHLSVSDFKNNKERLDFFKEIGVSVHLTEEAVWAQQNGATYLTAGHIFMTDCKKGVPPRGINFLREVCEEVPVPVYAIGGIRYDKLSAIKEAGAEGACIMSQFMKI
ncbi:MAG: thiamine phosphate synthase [Anaerocolumna sp.]